MPEVILPCPACGSNDSECILDDDGMYSVDCGNCAMRGPAELYPDSAIATWNSLPRRPDYNDVDCAGCPERRHSALTWTTEPPKVPGRYWWRWAKFQEHMCLYVRDGLIVEYPHKQLRSVAEIGGQWSDGPIPTPLEPEES